MGYQGDHLFYIEINDKDNAMDERWIPHKIKKKEIFICVMQRKIFPSYFVAVLISCILCDPKHVIPTIGFGPRPQTANNDEMTVILDGNEIK